MVGVLEISREVDEFETVGGEDSVKVNIPVDEEIVAEVADERSSDVVDDNVDVF